MSHKKSFEYCECKFVVESIRKGISFHSGECTRLKNIISELDSKIRKRELDLKKDWAAKNNYSPVLNEDGSRKVGSQKGYLEFPESIIKSDKIISDLQYKRRQFILQIDREGCK